MPAVTGDNLHHTEAKAWTDVCITTGKIKLYTSSSFLAACSPVFEMTLFADGQWKEREEKVIEMNQYTPNDLDELLSFFALKDDVISVTDNNVAFLCHFSERYEVEVLRGACIRFLKSRIDKDKPKLMESLILGYRYGIMSVVTKSFHAIIKEHTSLENFVLPKYVAFTEMPEQFIRCLCKAYDLILSFYKIGINSTSEQYIKQKLAAAIADIEAKFVILSFTPDQILHGELKQVWYDENYKMQIRLDSVPLKPIESKKNSILENEEKIPIA